MAALRSRFGLSLALALSLQAFAPMALPAQMGGIGGGVGGGGMGGGAGGRGGGMGARGGRGMGGGMKSPAAMARERLEQADPLEFLLDRKKPLELTKPQQESFKTLRKEMQRMQAPLFKDLETLFGDMPRREVPRGGGRGDSGTPSGGAPDTVRAVIGTLSDIQDSYRDRAREQLTPIQRTRADSLQQIMLAKARERFEKEREQRRERR
ncbi:hypothetical protein [Gemmatimonas groenlandica]|uniref:Periplasmic heavy metal sensor n=1 Tax=Gemmatimonas groenlandica TaxID=2732249 RepID=A0A6M4IGQ5_9BACT|nr:hypothetical protein [Gemmatimonas groenlandica]QJR34003.1 hypothetical protein HKW67_07450 [Gemmatimonas groenlandica]